MATMTAMIGATRYIAIAVNIYSVVTPGSALIIALFAMDMMTVET